MTTNVEDLYCWTEELRVKLSLGAISNSEIQGYKAAIKEKTSQYESLDSTYWVLAQNAEAHGLTVSESLKVSTY